MKKKILMNASDAKKHFLCSDSTLRRWHAEKKISVQRTLGLTRKYWVEIEVPDEEAPLSEEDLALVAVKEEAAKQQKIEESIEKYVALEDKNSLLGRYLSSYCIPHELLEDLEPPK